MHHTLHDAARWDMILQNQFSPMCGETHNRDSILPFALHLPPPTSFNFPQRLKHFRAPRSWHETFTCGIFHDKQWDSKCKPTCGCGTAYTFSPDDVDDELFHAW